MTGWYDGWREAKRRLESAPDDEFLSNLVDSLRGLALEDYLASFRGMDIYEEPLGVTAEQMQEFLTGLDELRAPSTAVLDELRRQLRVDTDKALGRMGMLPWSGDHLYGQALDDARKVLRAVLAGKPFPKLERFRCPSLFQPPAGEAYRCDLQLPHESNHKAHGIAWTDEQSVNPPKTYDEPVKPTDAQMDKLADEVFGESQCRSMWGTHRCDLKSGHAPVHSHESHTGNVFTWPDSYATGEAGDSPDPINRPTTELNRQASDDGPCANEHPTENRRHCERAKRHLGLHRDASGVRWE